MISKIHFGLPNAYKLMCFNRKINGNWDVKILECDYLLVQWCVKLTLGRSKMGEKRRTSFMDVPKANKCHRFVHSAKKHSVCRRKRQLKFTIKNTLSQKLHISLIWF